MNVNRNPDFFLQNESIRDSNRIDSNRESECSTTGRPGLFLRLLLTHFVTYKKVLRLIFLSF